MITIVVISDAELKVNVWMFVSNVWIAGGE